MKKLLLLLLVTPLSIVSAQSWTEQNTNTVDGSYIGDISIVDANVAWAMVQRTSTINHQAFSKTTDGGNTWTAGTISVGNTSGLGIGNITAVDANTAWVSVFPTSASLATQGVYKTTNGGTTWTRQASAAFTAASFCNFVYFWDANNGVCMGDKKSGYFEIYTTTNGGTNWTRTPSANIPATPTDYGYTGKYGVSGNTIWFGTDNGELMRSTDKGLTWTLISTPLTDFGGGTDPNSNGEFAFKDNNNGVIQQTVSQEFYVTTDGGANWVLGAPTGMFWGGIAYAGDMLVSVGSTTGNFGSSFSNDNGVTWTEIDQLSHTCVSFKDANTGWGGGFASAGLGGAFKFNPGLATSSFAANKVFQVSPNPANNFVTIASNNVDSFTVAVTDLTGKTVLNTVGSSVNNTLDISSLSNGVYFFTISADNKSETIKIIKN